MESEEKWQKPTNEDLNNFTWNISTQTLLKDFIVAVRVKAHLVWQIVQKNVIIGWRASSAAGHKQKWKRAATEIAYLLLKVWDVIILKRRPVSNIVSCFISQQACKMLY